MNNITMIINQIYNNMIGIILCDIESDYHKAISKKYMDTLVNRYSDIDFDSAHMQEVYSSLYEIEYKEWSSMPSDMKKHIFMNDNALNEIINLASIAFKFAKDRLDNNVLISKKVADEYVLKLNELYNDVEDFNKNLALWYISESSLDLYYASNQTENMSRRISHIKK